MLVEMTQVRNITANFNIACHTLTLTHTPSNSESGADPTASPDRSSPECAVPGEYIAGHIINLLASPNADWQVESWLNTNNDASTANTNILTFPTLPSATEGYIVTVNYIKQPTLQFKDNGYRVIESVDKEIVVSVKRTGSLAETVSVKYATRNGSAKSGQDYVATNGTLIFEPEESEKSFTARIKDDKIKEGDESFFVTLSNPVDALLGSLDEIEITNFDLVVSKDSFEHIIEVPKMLDSIRSHVSDGGRVYIGFSPLYHSPYGDHDRRRAAFRPWGIFGKILAAIPWGHLLLEKKILKMQSQLQKREIKSMQDINLNKMSIGEFRTHISDSDLAIDSFRVNQGDSKIGSVFAILRKIPLLEKHNKPFPTIHVSGFGANR